MTSVYEPARLAQRMCLELYHGQSSLLDEEPPVLIRATPLPGVTNGGSGLPSELLPAVLSNDNAGSAQDLSGTRALPAKGA